MTSKVQNQIWDIESEIEDLTHAINQEKEKYETPQYEGIEGEIEEFFAEIGPNAAEILNSGVYTSDEDMSYALREVGINNPEQVIQTYYYYYPEYDPKKEKEHKKSAEKIERLKDKIEQLENKLDKLQGMYESVNESKYNVVNADPYEIQDLKDYLDAENISYFEDEEGDTLDFDETELDKEWKDRIDSMGMKEESNFEEGSDILSIEDENDEDLLDKDDQIDEEKVFFVKVTDEDSEFVGKIYKLFDEGDWRTKIVKGESDTFEKLNYDPDYDEFDIIAFLRENYDDAELIDEEEFNEDVENYEEEPIEENLNESLLTSLEDIYNYFMKVDVSKLDLNKEINQIFMKGFKGKPLPPNVNSGTPKYKAWQAGRKRREGIKEHNIPTLDDFLKENHV
jgi:hypothetical protein